MDHDELEYPAPNNTNEANAEDDQFTDRLPFVSLRHHVVQEILMSRLPRNLTVACGVICVTLAAGAMAAQAQNLRLIVDPYSGAASIYNPAGTPSTLDGYQITSP